MAAWLRLCNGAESLAIQVSTVLWSRLLLGLYHPSSVEQVEQVEQVAGAFKIRIYTQNSNSLFYLLNLLNLLCVNLMHINQIDTVDYL